MTKRSTIKKLASATVNDPRWAALIGRDSSADGRFYYSVKTTGVYCPPSCAARPARPENVQFHLTCEDAENRVDSQLIPEMKLLAQATGRTLLAALPRQLSVYRQRETRVR